MAARSVKIRHDEETRAKIKVSQLLNRLQNHVLGNVEMSQTQIRAAEVCLKKAMPDLVYSESHNVVEHQFAVVPKTVNPDQWQDMLQSRSGLPNPAHKLS